MSQFPPATVLDPSDPNKILDRFIVRLNRAPRYTNLISHLTMSPSTPQSPSKTFLTDARKKFLGCWLAKGYIHLDYLPSGFLLDVSHHVRLALDLITEKHEEVTRTAIQASCIISCVFDQLCVPNPGNSTGPMTFILEGQF